MKPKIYIAGPDLFLPDWTRRAARMQALCAEYGLAAVLPVPPSSLTGPGITEPSDVGKAQEVFQSCQAAVKNVDGVIANLMPFRGHEPDSGTVVECALAWAGGKPVVGYASRPAMPPSRAVDADGRVLAEDGGWIEQFGLSHNVMLYGVCLDIVEQPEQAVAMMASLMETRFSQRTKTRLLSSESEI